MNLIEAWNEARKEQYLKRDGTHCLIMKYGLLTIAIEKHLSNTDIIADDWEIVKEKKKVVIEDVGWEFRSFSDWKDKNINVSKCEIAYPACQRHLLFISGEIKNKPKMKMTLEWTE